MNRLYTPEGLRVVTLEDLISLSSEHLDMLNRDKKIYIIDRKLKDIRKKDFLFEDEMSSKCGATAKKYSKRKSELEILYDNFYMHSIIFPYELLGGFKEPCFPKVSQDTIDSFNHDIIEVYDIMGSKGLEGFYKSNLIRVKNENPILFSSINRSLKVAGNLIKKDKTKIISDGIILFSMSYELLRRQAEKDRDARSFALSE